MDDLEPIGELVTVVGRLRVLDNPIIIGAHRRVMFDVDWLFVGRKLCAAR